MNLILKEDASHQIDEFSYSHIIKLRFDIIIHKYSIYNFVHIIDINIIDIEFR